MSRCVPTDLFCFARDRRFFRALRSELKMHSLAIAERVVPQCGCGGRVIQFDVSYILIVEENVLMESGE